MELSLIFGSHPPYVEVGLQFERKSDHSRWLSHVCASATARPPPAALRAVVVLVLFVVFVLPLALRVTAVGAVAVAAVAAVVEAVVQLHPSSSSQQATSHLVGF